MRTITVVTALKTVEVPAVGGDEWYKYKYTSLDRLKTCSDGTVIVGGDDITGVRIVPIHKIFNAKKWSECLYIAYTDEVDLLLGCPFRILEKEIASLKKEIKGIENRAWQLTLKINDYKKLSFWKKLPYLFGKKI